MSQTKAQLIEPIGVVTASGVVVSGVATAASFDGAIVGSATSVIQGKNLNLGAVNAVSFAGDFTGNATGIITSSAIKVGSLTASSFVGDFTGTATSMFKGTGFTAGTVNAQGFVADVTGNVTGDVTGNIAGDVTGNVTGDASGHAGGLGVNYNGGWTGAGTSQISVGVITATSFYGDGSNLAGVSGGPVSQQAVTINGASTTIDLSNGNLIYATQTADTTVSFANSENGNVYFVRIPDGTERTLTWPDRVKWDGGTTPILATTSNDYQVFLLVTRDEGVTWYGKVTTENTEAEHLYAWGSNSYGWIGNDRTNRSSPTQIGSATNWKAVGTGQGHIVSTKTDGSLWTWGGNEYGQLGQNNLTFRSSPVQLPGTTWNLTDGNHMSCLATRTDGTLWTWGQNHQGQLGLNNTTQYSSPVQLPGTTWGNNFSTNNESYHVIKTDGTLWSWGYNTYGQLGQN